VTATGAARCPVEHELAHTRSRCPRCRRDGVIEKVAAVETSLSSGQVAAAVDVVAGNRAVLRCLATAFAADPDALAHGAPPVVGKLIIELIACGSTVLAVPACVVCGRTGKPLTVTESGGMCQRCAARRNSAALHALRHRQTGRGSHP
jgi:hypothetical protein